MRAFRLETQYMNTTKAILDVTAIRRMYQGLAQIHLRFGILWLFGIESGLRIGDLLLLRVNSAHEAAQGHSMTVIERKTGKTRVIDISSSCLEDMLELINRQGLSTMDYIFYSSDKKRNKPMTRQWAHHRIALTASKMGLNLIGAHSMRKIYACNLYRATESLNCVQRALNHRSAETTLLYLREVLIDA